MHVNESSDFESGSVGEEAQYAISKLLDREGNLAVGNTVRRACEWAGEGACKQVCQLAGPVMQDMYAEARGGEVKASDNVAEALAESACADMNVLHAFNELGLEPKDVLMVGVTANGVGSADSLDEYDKLTHNPYGWRELPGFNAFFAREGEVKGLGRRLADCADINFEFKDSDGNIVFGFEHGTRTNMFGSTRFAFEHDGEKMSYTEYVLRQTIEHYGVDPTAIRINLAAALQGQNNTFTFESAEKMEEVVPGWQADGFLKNVINPAWQTGDPVNPEDTWEADTRGMIIRDIEAAMQTLGIPADNFDKSDILDPNESNGMHSSHKTSYLTKSPSTRDLYITYIKK